MSCVLVEFFCFLFFCKFKTKPNVRSINLQKKGESNIFSIRTEQASSMRFILYIDFPARCFLFRVKLVYVQAVREKGQENRNSDETV